MRDESRTNADETQAVDGAVSRALVVLELLARAKEPVRLSDIAQQLGMQKSTVHRILSTLIGRGYVEQEESSSCYRATLRLWELGSGLIEEHPIKRAATAFLHRLHQATRETVSLTVLSGDDVLYLDKLISPRPIRFTSRIGSRLPAIVTAGGKAMLAHEPDARAIIRRSQQQIDKPSRLNLEALLGELKESQRTGYATSTFRAGVISFAVPIMGRAGRAAAAISVSAPTSRITPEKREAIIEQLLVTGTEIAERVGAL